MLTNAVIKGARPRAAGYKIADVGGMHLYVAPNGRKTFRMRFRWQAREQLLTFGRAEEMTLEEARQRTEAARERLANGLDPRACEIAPTDDLRAFEYHARAWHRHMLPRWTEVHAADVLASLERDVLPAIGAMPLAAITPPVVLSALRLVEGRGRYETARRVRQRISAVFELAISNGHTHTDPAAIVGRALMPPAPTRRQPALLRIEDVRRLLADVDYLAAAPAVKAASTFLALTAVRLAAVRGARWCEIEDLDGAAPLWRVPAARMKLARAKKSAAENDHLVPLSRQAVELLRSLRSSSEGSDLIFIGRSGAAAIGEAAIGDLYSRAGYSGRHVPHGWRATFSTIMNDRQPEHRAAIDRALAHAGAGVSKVEAAYNRAEQLGLRQRLLQDWADELLPSPSTVISCDGKGCASATA